MFLAILTAMYKSKDDFFIYLITAIIAVISSYLLDNTIYILISALLGSIISVLLKKEHNG